MKMCKRQKLKVKKLHLNHQSPVRAAHSYHCAIDFVDSAKQNILPNATTYIVYTQFGLPQTTSPMLSRLLDTLKGWKCSGPKNIFSTRATISLADVDRCSTESSKTEKANSYKNVPIKITWAYLHLRKQWHIELCEFWYGLNTGYVCQTQLICHCWLCIVAAIQHLSTVSSPIVWLDDVRTTWQVWVATADRLSCVTCHEDDNLTSLMTSNERQRQRRHDDRIPWHVTMSDCCRIWRSVVGGSQNCHNTRLISLCPWIESLLIGNLATVIMMLPYL